MPIQASISLPRVSNLIFILFLGMLAGAGGALLGMFPLKWGLVGLAVILFVFFGLLFGFLRLHGIKLSSLTPQVYNTGNSSLFYSHHLRPSLHPVSMPNNYLYTPNCVPFLGLSCVLPRPW